jgi:acetyl esterase
MRFRGWALLTLCSSGFATPSLGVSVHKNVEYSQVAGTALLLDAAIPHGAGPFPAAIIVHGGGWVRGDRRVDVQRLFQPLSDAGFAWFSIDYRLMQDVTQFGTAIEDVAAAVRFVKAHAAEYSVDPNRIVLVGESAGGQLAAMAALNTPDLRVRAVVALYTPMDLVALAKNSKYVPQWIHDNIQNSPYAWFITERLKQLSPIDHVRRDMPPFLLIHGTGDPLVPFAQSEAMRDRMKGAGADCELYALRGAGHGLRWWEAGISEAYQAEMVRWLKKHLT